MICPKCNKEYSDKVFKLHFKRCIVEEVKKVTDKDIRAKAQELGIKSWHNKNIDKLKSEIKEVSHG